MGAIASKVSRLWHTPSPGDSGLGDETESRCAIEADAPEDPSHLACQAETKTRCALESDAPEDPSHLACQEERMPWEVARLIASSLKKGVGGTCVDDLKRWHMAGRLTRDAARECATTLVISVHGKWTDLAQALQLFAQVQKLEVSVQLCLPWKLGVSPLSPSLIERLAKMPTKILRIQAEEVSQCAADAAHSNLQRCAALNSVMAFDSLIVDERGAYAGAAVRTLCPSMSGSLRKLVCPGIATVPDADWFRGLSSLEEVRFTSCNAAVLRAGAQLPRLRKLTCMVSSEEAWLELCKLTQLQDLCAHVICPARADYSELYSLNRLTHLRLFVPPPSTWEGLMCGLLLNMPLLEELSLVPSLHQHLLFCLPNDFSHGRLRRVSFRTSLEGPLGIREWCPNLEEIVVNGRVAWRKPQG